MAQAFPISEDTSIGVTVSRGEAVWSASRAGTSWTVDGRETPAAQDVVDALADAVIHYRREPVPPLEETWATVEIESDDRVYTIDLGQVVDDTFRVVLDRAGGGPVLVPMVDLAVLDQPLPKGE